MSYLKIAESTKQYKEAEKLIAIVELIAKCKSRMQDRRELCEDWFGKNEAGKIKCTQDDVDYIARYYAIGLRLKLYYNNCLAKMTAFKIVSHESATA